MVSPSPSNNDELRKYAMSRNLHDVGQPWLRGISYRHQLLDELKAQLATRQSKHAKKYLLRRIRLLEKELGVPGEPYNKHAKT